MINFLPLTNETLEIIFAIDDINDDLTDTEIEILNVLSILNDRNN